MISGELHAIRDGVRTSASAGGTLELPEGSVHAIWATHEVEFEVSGQRGLGLIVVVPRPEGGTEEVPVYSPEGPWASEPPPGGGYTTDVEMASLRKLSKALL